MKKILVADDSVTIQKVIALTFAEESFEIQSVGTGSDALDKIKEWQPDIVLADVIMPQMNGYELSKAIKEDQSTSNIPVLLLAGTFEAFDEEEAKAAGADDYITKPFESGELISKVKNLTGLVDTAPAQEPVAAVPEVPEQVPQEIPSEPLPQADPPAAESISAAVPSPEPPAAVVEELTADFPESVDFEPVAPEATSPSADGEPDIWDILSEVSSDIDTELPSAAPPEAETSVPSLGPLEDAGVVDVGSFEVGLDREVESVPEVPIVGAEIKPEEEVVEFSPVPQESPVNDISHVEERERDFFGLDESQETGPDIGSLDDAIEEISFEVEEVSQGADEASFIVPDLLENQQETTGETVSPEVFMSDIPAEAGQVEEIPDVHTEPDPASVEMSPTAEEIAPVLEVQDIPSAAVPEAVPDEGEMPVLEEPQPEASVPVAGDQIQIDDDRIMELVRKIAEEKAEKVAWEVIPELAEVLIREAIAKIKSES
ncbi:MAG: response regulator [bacterium]